MRPRRPRPLLRALCAALLTALLAAGVAADAAPAGGSIGTPIVQPRTPAPANATTSATADTGSAPEAAAPVAAPAANTTTPAAAAAPPPAPAAAVVVPQPVTPAPASANAPEAGADAESPAPAEAPEDDEAGDDDEGADADGGGVDEAADDEDEAGVGDDDEDDGIDDDDVQVEEADESEQGFGGRREVELRSPTLVDAFNVDGELISVKHLSRFEERICPPRRACDSAIVSAMMLVASAAGAFIITHVATFLPAPRTRAEPPSYPAADPLSSVNTANTATTASSVYRPSSGDHLRWPHFFHFYRTHSKARLRLGFSWLMFIPAAMWAALAFVTTFLVAPSEVDFRLDAPVYLAVTEAAGWGAMRFDGCNDILWRVDDDGGSPLYLTRTIRRCYDARRLAALEVPPALLPPPGGEFASMLITSDHVRVAVLYENGRESTISRVSARVEDLRERQPVALAALRGGAGGGRTDASGMFLSSRFRPEALIPYFEAAMEQEQYAECGPPTFRFLGDDGTTFSGRWLFTCSPQRGATLGVDGLLFAVFLRHTEYRFDPAREGEAFEVFVPVRGVEDVAGEVIEVMGWSEGLLIGRVGVIWCNWLCSVVVATVMIALAATVAVLAAFFAKNLPVL